MKGTPNQRLILPLSASDKHNDALVRRFGQEIRAFAIPGPMALNLGLIYTVKLLAQKNARAFYAGPFTGSRTDLLAAIQLFSPRLDFLPIPTLASEETWRQAAERRGNAKLMATFGPESLDEETEHYIFGQDYGCAISQMAECVRDFGPYLYCGPREVIELSGDRSYDDFPRIIHSVVIPGQPTDGLGLTLEISDAVQAGAALLVLHPAHTELLAGPSEERANELFATIIEAINNA